MVVAITIAVLALVIPVLLFLLSWVRNWAFLDFRCSCRHTFSKPYGSTYRGGKSYLCTSCGDSIRRVDSGRPPLTCSSRPGEKCEWPHCTPVGGITGIPGRTLNCIRRAWWHFLDHDE